MLLGAFPLSPATDRMNRICSLNTRLYKPCLTVLSNAYNAYSKWRRAPELLQQSAAAQRLTIDETAALHIELMQYATENDMPRLLHQNLLDTTDADWTFYGWLMVLDWLQGSREVVAFEGDVSTIVEISKQYQPELYQVESISIPTEFTVLATNVCVYTTSIVVVLICLTASYGVLAKGNLNGMNLVFFTPVASVVWIGRPLVILRGLTAMTLLCTANLKIDTNHGVSAISASITELY